MNLGHLNRISCTLQSIVRGRPYFKFGDIEADESESAGQVLENSTPLQKIDESETMFKKKAQPGPAKAGDGGVQSMLSFDAKYLGCHILPDGFPPG